MPLGYGLVCSKVILLYYCSLTFSSLISGHPTIINYGFHILCTNGISLQGFSHEALFGLSHVKRYEFAGSNHIRATMYTRGSMYPLSFRSQAYPSHIVAGISVHVLLPKVFSWLFCFQNHDSWLTFSLLTLLSASRDLVQLLCFPRCFMHPMLADACLEF